MSGLVDLSAGQRAAYVAEPIKRNAEVHATAWISGVPRTGGRAVPVARAQQVSARKTQYFTTNEHRVAR